MKYDFSDEVKLYMIFDILRDTVRTGLLLDEKKDFPVDAMKYNRNK